MDYIRFGQTGLKVSQLCLGTMSMGSSAWKGWVLDEGDSIPILRRALDLGITFFDMADWYSTGRNEEVVGQNLLRMSARERLVLATKVYYPMSERPERSRSVAQAHRDLDRPVAGADGYRLRRPLRDPCLRCGHARRGNDGGAARYGPRRQGALPRRLHDVCVAVREDEPRGGDERLDAIRQHAVPVQRALPRGRARDAPLLPGPGHRRHDLQSARARLPRARRPAPRARPTTSIRNSTATRSTARSHAACARWPRAGA